MKVVNNAAEIIVTQFEDELGKSLDILQGEVIEVGENCQLEKGMLVHFPHARLIEKAGRYFVFDQHILPQV